MSKVALFRAAVLCCLICVSTSAYAQINIYGLVNEMARQAAEAQRRQQEIQQQRRAQQQIIMEQRRRAAEIKAEEKHERDREAAEEAKREAAQREARRQAQAAAAEREAVARLAPAAKQLIGDATEFLQTNPPRALDIVQQVADLNSSLSASSSDKIQSLMQQLVSTLRSQPGYDTFEQARGEKKREEANVYLAELLKTATQQKDFIRYYVTNHPTDPSTIKLLPIIKKLETAIAAPDLEPMRTLTSEVEVAIREAGLSDEYLRSKNVVGDNAPGKVQGASSGAFSKTTKNAFLFDGKMEDFVLLYNASPSSPHVIKNLHGDFAFDKSKARACLYQAGFDRDEIHLLRSTLEKYELKPANIAIDQAECNRSDLGSYDVVAVERGAFLHLKPELSLALLSEVEKGKFGSLVTVTQAERLAAQQADEKLRAEIKTDIEHGGRVGYGIIIVRSNISAVCLVAKDKIAGHKQWVDQNIDRLSAELTIKSLPTMGSLDAAFQAVERQQCAGVYGSAADLKQLADALDRDHKQYTFAPVWAKDDEITALNDGAKAREADEAAEIERHRQNVISEQKLRNELAAADAQKKENREKQLRSQYGKIASADAAAITDQVRHAFNAGQDWQATPAFAQFPTAVAAYQNLIESRWELQSLNSEVSDYGTADWKGRKLEASFAKVSIRMRNRILGEYKDVCFIFGRMNDTEFNMVRDGIGTTCDNVQAVQAWKQGHQFNSLWFAE